MLAASMARPQELLVAALIASILLTACSATAAMPSNATLELSATATAYDILVKYNLPRGLLPKGVQSYTLTPEGKIDVVLPGVCDFHVTVGGAVYKMRFGDRVGGLIKPGSIGQTHGVRIQVSFWWLGISGIDRVGDQLMISAQQGKPMPFPVSDFAVSPSCRS